MTCMDSYCGHCRLCIMCTGVCIMLSVLYSYMYVVLDLIVNTIFTNLFVTHCDNGSTVSTYYCMIFE